MIVTCISCKKFTECYDEGIGYMCAECMVKYQEYLELKEEL